VEGAYYGEPTSRIAAAKLKLAAGNHGTDALRYEISRLQASLRIVDEDYYGPYIDLLRDMDSSLLHLGSAKGRRTGDG
jgi:hypothetical protein